MGVYKEVMEEPIIERDSALRLFTKHKTKLPLLRKE